MAGWRVNVWLKEEKEFGVENTDTDAKWKYIGIGMDFTISTSNSWTTKGGIGSKFQMLQYEGRFKGTFNGNLYLDYNNMDWLAYALEGYSFFKDESDKDNPRGVHLFYPSPNKSLRSFTLCF